MRKKTVGLGKESHIQQQLSKKSAEGYGNQHPVEPPQLEYENTGSPAGLTDFLTEQQLPQNERVMRLREMVILFGEVILEKYFVPQNPLPDEN